MVQPLKFGNGYLISITVSQWLSPQPEWSMGHKSDPWNIDRAEICLERRHKRGLCHIPLALPNEPLWYIDCEYQMGGWELLSIHGIEPVFINMFAFSIGFMPHCILLGGQYYSTHHWISAVLCADMGWRGVLETICAKTYFNSLPPGRFEWKFSNFQTDFSY